MKKLELQGMVFGKLRADEATSKRSGTNVVWRCTCLRCGSTCYYPTNDLRAGKVKTCGCLHGNSSHGMSNTRAYSMWQNMRQRCNNPKHPYYKDYGGRGIYVCARWAKFVNFFADMGECPHGLTLERKNNDKGYYKRNCCWATPKEQVNNRRNSKPKAGIRM